MLHYMLLYYLDIYYNRTFITTTTSIKMKITYLGHASLSIEFGGKTILVDPFFTGNPLTHISDIDQVEADYILVTHAHVDHVKDVHAIASRTGAVIISNYEIYLHFTALGHKCHPLNHGGKFSFNFGTVKYVSAIHTSAFPDGSYGGNPGGFVIWNDEQCIYIAGDTALTMDMKLIPMTCPKLDIAVLPIGDNFTMGYEDAAIASGFIACDDIIGYHYNTFPPIEIDKAAALKYFTSKNKTLRLPKLGETIII